jgi:hypothetical protein
LVDYLDIVKFPIDLGTVSKKLENKNYKWIEEFLNDI